MEIVVQLCPPSCAGFDAGLDKLELMVDTFWLDCANHDPCEQVLLDHGDARSELPFCNTFFKPFCCYLS